jgi:hypothetical protein
MLSGVVCILHLVLMIGEKSDGGFENETTGSVQTPQCQGFHLLEQLTDRPGGVFEFMTGVIQPESSRLFVFLGKATLAASPRYLAAW